MKIYKFNKINIHNIYNNYLYVEIKFSKFSFNILFF